MSGDFEPRVLVTGATGFIGAGLCRRFQDLQIKVASAQWLGENDPPCLPGVSSRLIRDIGPDTDWSRALSGIDTVIHLAARVHIMNETTPDPLEEFRRVNAAGTERLAYEAAAHGVRRLVFLSSVKVNGEGRERPYTETDPAAPEDPYGISKWEAELALKKVAADTGLEVVVIRPPLVYGPGVKANFFRLLCLIAQGVPLPLASITNARSLVYRGNLIDAIITCATNPRAAGQTFLVSDGIDVSTPKLIRLVAAALGRPARLIPVPTSLIRITGKLTGKSLAVDRLLGSLTVDSGKIRRELGWKPPYTMEEGLAETARWFEQC